MVFVDFIFFFWSIDYLIPKKVVISVFKFYGNMSNHLHYFFSQNGFVFCSIGFSHFPFKKIIQVLLLIINSKMRIKPIYILGTKVLISLEYTI